MLLPFSALIDQNYFPETKHIVQETPQLHKHELHTQLRIEMGHSMVQFSMLIQLSLEESTSKTRSEDEEKLTMSFN